MKRLLKGCSFIALQFVLAVSAQAQAVKTYRAEIPFYFNIGQDSYIPGIYHVSVLKNMILIRHEKATTSRVLTTTFEEKGKGFEVPKFYFNRVEDKNVLVEIAGKDFSVKLEDISAAARDKLARKLTAQTEISDHRKLRTEN